MKYKVGDKVRVRSDLEVGKEYGKDIFVRSMEPFKGTTIEIEHVCSDSEYRIKGGDWYSWTDEMFEGLEDGKMYASELMELARKEPEKYEGKQYKASGDVILKRTGDRADTDIITFKYGCPIVEGHATAFMSARTELEEIKPEPKPVPFIEAREAFENGKVIIAKFPDFNNGRMITTRYWKSSDGCDRSDPDDCDLSFYIIRTAEWFIEEA